jgi:hypothetical protein
MADLGVGPQFDVKPNEIGFAMILGTHIQVQAGEAANAGITFVKPGLLAALVRISAGVRGPIRSVKWSTASVRILDAARSEVAVVVQRSSEWDDGASDDRVLDRLLRAIQAGQLVADCGTGDPVPVTSAALMVPKRIPR